jgi:hypothetical protein
VTRRTETKKDKTQRLLTLFGSQHQVLVDRERVEKVELEALTGNPENQVVRLAWKQKGVQFSVILTEDGLANAEIYQDRVECEDHEGEPIEIQFMADDAILTVA